VSAADRLAADAAVRTREIRAAYHGAGAYVFAALTVDIAALRLPPAAVYATVFCKKPVHLKFGDRQTDRRFRVYQKEPGFRPSPRT